MRNPLCSFRIGRGQSPTISKLMIGSLPARRIGQALPCPLRCVQHDVTIVGTGLSFLTVRNSDLRIAVFLCCTGKVRLPNPVSQLSDLMALKFTNGASIKANILIMRQHNVAQKANK